MKKKSPRSTSRKNTWDPQKDNIFKQLADIMLSQGYAVRREELKQGHGWKVASGSCRLDQQRLIFVDRKRPQDDQIAFLAQRMKSAGIQISDEQLASIPEKIQQMLTATPNAINPDAIAA